MKVRLRTQTETKQAVGGVRSKLGIGGRTTSNTPGIDLAPPQGSSVLIKQRKVTASEMDPWSKTTTKVLTKSGTRQAKRERRLTAFIAIPFNDKYDKVFEVIKQSCELVNIKAIRADEIAEPGPIINQIFDNIRQADVVIAEVGSRNPNVYYELALAHCVEIPSVLLSDKKKLGNLPFDISHNRVYAYTPEDFSRMKDDLVRSLDRIKDELTGETRPTIDDRLSDLSYGKEEPRTSLQQLIEQVGDEFDMVNPKLESEEPVSKGGIFISVKDSFGVRVGIRVDRNGIIREKRRL